MVLDCWTLYVFLALDIFFFLGRKALQYYDKCAFHCLVSNFHITNLAMRFWDCFNAVLEGSYLQNVGSEAAH